MKRFGLLVVAALAGWAMLAQAADPLEVAPAGVYMPKLENERVRVLELNVQPGQSIPMHSHPDHFVYVTGGGTLRLTHPDGTSADVAAEPGQVLWIPAESHATVNVGATAVRGLVVELKS